MLEIIVFNIFIQPSSVDLGALVVCPTVRDERDKHFSALAVYGQLMSSTAVAFRVRGLQVEDACFITLPLFIAACDSETYFAWLPDSIIWLLASWLLAATYVKVPQYNWKKYAMDRSIFEDFPKDNGIRAPQKFYETCIDPHYTLYRTIRSINFGLMFGDRDWEGAVNPEHQHHMEYYSHPKSGWRMCFIHVNPAYAEHVVKKVEFTIRRCCMELPGFANRVRVKLHTPTTVIAHHSLGGLIWNAPCIEISVRECKVHHWARSECAAGGKLLFAKMQYMFKEEHKLQQKCYKLRKLIHHA